MTAERSSYIRAMKKYAEDFAIDGKYHDRTKAEAKVNSDDVERNNALEGQSSKKEPPRDIGVLIYEFLGIRSYDDPIRSVDFTRDQYNVSSSADLTSNFHLSMI